MEENKEYDSKLLDSMEDIYERENELLNKSNEQVEEVEEKKDKEVKKSKSITTYYNDMKLSLMRYKNIILILLIYIIINIKQLEDFINNLLSRFKLSINTSYVLTNMLKGMLFLVILYLLGVKVLF